MKRQDRFRSLMEQSPYPIEFLNPEGKIEQVNSAWLRLWDLDETEAPEVLEKYNMLTDPQLVDLGVAKLVKKAFDGEPVVLPPIQYSASQTAEDFEMVVELALKTPWIQCHVYPVKDQQGKVDFVVNTYMDITEVVERTAQLEAMIDRHRKTEGVLARSEERFRNLMEQSPSPIVIFNPRGRIEQVNSAWRSTWGLNEEETAQVRKVYSVLADQQLIDLGMGPLIKKAFEGQSVVLPPVQYFGVQTMEELGLPDTNAKTVWIQTYFYPVKDQKGKVDFVVSTVLDVTEQKEAADQIEAYQERLRALAAELTITEEQERRRIATELHDGAAQSLAFARIQLSSLEKSVIDEQASTKLCEISRTLKDSLQQIREVLLDLSSPALNEIGLSAALSEWLEQVGRRHGLTASFVDECGMVPLSDDVRALLFRNTRELIMNCVKHAEATAVSVHMAASDQELRITVEDDGRGFESDLSDQKPGREGGFGLFSIRERMADMDGKLEIESARGKGCKATLTVPLGDETR